MIVLFKIQCMYYKYTIITLCAYAQQGYAFGRVGLCICVYICGQKTGCLRSYHLKIYHWYNLLLAC